MNQFRQVKLKNGVRAVLVPVPATAAVTCMVFYEVGSRYEPDRLAGAAHLIEHMCFKGTKRRPSTMHISRELDSVGAEYNAFTDYDSTGYYVRLQADRLELAVDLLDDMVYDSLYRPADLKSEVGVISEELKMYDDNPLMAVNEQMQEELFPNLPIGRRIGGTPESVAAIKRKDLLEFRRRYYRPSRTAIALAGNFQAEEAERLLNQRFGRRTKPSLPDRGFQKYRPPARPNGPRCRVVGKELEQVQVSLGVPAFPVGAQETAAQAVLANVLGGSMSSRLFITVRERHGLAYHIRSHVQSFQDTGVFLVHAGLAKDFVEPALKLIVEELKKIKDRPVTSEELKRAKENIKGHLTLSLEDSSHLASWYGRLVLLAKKPKTPAQRIAEIMAVTKADVQRVAKRLLKSSQLAMAVIGPFDQPEPFKKLARKL